MKLEEAMKVLENAPAVYPQKQAILRGLTILARFDTDIDCAFEHDQMFACSFETTITQMSEAEITELGHLGWFESYDSWSHF